LPRKSEDGKLAPGYVHAKIYIIDEAELFAGSANFTWNGFQNNFEVVAHFPNPLLAKAVHNELEEFLNSAKMISLESLGPTLFPEPRN
jgi:phosphatidylserine/phosphatidylglycerophosphate/cardiolipin synthase-like enzyme